MDERRAVIRRLAATALRFGLAMLAFGLFIGLTHELRERDVDAVDRALLLAVAGVRRGWLNGVAVDLTALGSASIITILTIVALIVLSASRDRRGAAQLLVATIGSAIWTRAAKGFIERPRPSVIPRLVEVSGFSYPSGHSLAATATFLTVALLATRHMRSPTSRALLHATMAAIVVLVAASRVYLGVHYPSDVASGVLVGAAWALLLHSAFAISSSRRAT